MTKLAEVPDAFYADDFVLGPERGLLGRAVDRLRHLLANPRDTWGSHLYVFRELFEWTGDLESIVEFGSGEFSTPFLAEHCRELISVETSRRYYNRARELYPGVTVRFVPAQFMHEFNVIAPWTDLVFVDSDRRFRKILVEWALEQRVPYVVLHDADKPRLYGYDRVRVPSGYLARVCRVVPKTTVLLTTDTRVGMGVQWKA